MVKSSSLIAFALISAAVQVLATEAKAATTVTAVGNASNAVIPGMTDPTTGTPATTTSIYGGVAGWSASLGSPTNTIDTCFSSSQISAFAPCNNNAINGETQLVITIKSDKGGYPVLFPPSNGSSTLAVTPVAPPALIPAGGTGSITFRWGNICAGLSQSTNDCSFAAGTENTTPSGTFTIGVLANASDTVAISGETSPIQFTIATIAPNHGTDSTTGNLASGEVGLNEFEIGNGDSKVILKSLNGTGVPQGTHLVFQKVRLLSEQATDENDAVTTAFGRIKSTSHANDLLISTSAADGSISLSPARVTGFTNDTFYAFKVGMIDLAGNIGYYSDNSIDTDCTWLTSNPTTKECHVGHPGEVVGVLSKNLNCFVATAAYGSQMAPQVQTFRDFRDRFLLTVSWGRRFVNFYYAHSPKYARIIAESATLRAVARGFLWPLLAFAWLSVHLGLWPAFLTCAFILSALAFFCRRLLDGQRRSEEKRA